MQRSPVRGYVSGGARDEGRPRLKLAGAAATRGPVPWRKRAVRVAEPPAPAEPEVRGPAVGPLQAPARQVWVWVFGALITMAFFGALVFRSRDPGPHRHESARVEARVEGPPGARAGEGESIEGWDRLNQALARVPVEQVAGILREANTWLAAQGSTGCSVRAGRGQISIVLGAGSLNPRPLRAALSRCADAVEYVMQQAGNPYQGP